MRKASGRRRLHPTEGRQATKTGTRWGWGFTKADTASN